MKTKLPKGAKLTCLSVDCPERKSICCGAISETSIADEGTGCFLCSKCKKEFLGGKCTAGEVRESELKLCMNCNTMKNISENSNICRRCIDKKEVKYKPTSSLSPNKENLREEELAQKLHEWYLEACQNPESGTDFNPEAQVLYKNLRESQKFLDRYIASKVLSLLSEREEAVKNEIIKELYFSATLYSDGSPTLMHSYLERKYPEVLEAIIRGENK